MIKNRVTLLNPFFHSLNVDDGEHKYVVVSGPVPMPRGMASTDEPPVTSEDLYYMVSIVVPQLEESVVVNARMSHTLNVLSAVAYSQPMPLQDALEQQSSVESEAVAVSFSFLLSVFSHKELSAKILLTYFSWIVIV